MAEKWYPILACEEYQPGHWVMLDQYRRPYAMIDIIRIRDEVGYKVTTWAQESAQRELIGYFRTLMASARHGHQRFLASHTRASKGHDITGRPLPPR